MSTADDSEQRTVMGDWLPVWVVDDDAAVRDALLNLLAIEGFSVQGFASARAFLRSFSGEAGCLVLDVRMPDMDGFELQSVLAERGVEVPIVFLTGHGDVPMSARAFKGGAVDFLEKPVEDERLIASVREGLARAENGRAAREHRARLEARVSRLTPREREVMALVVGGHTSKEIARLLGVSHRTVEAHRAAIMEKTESRSLPALVELAAACGLVGAE